MTKEEITISALSLCSACLLVFVLYFATTKWDTREALDQCNDLVIQEGNDHTIQLEELVSKLTFCREVKGERVPEVPGN